MSDLVDPTSIEDIVGSNRHPTLHLGRAVSDEQTFYILHSTVCCDITNDLRDCPFSKALDNGINLAWWKGWTDLAVTIWLADDGTIRPGPGPYGLSAGL